ncbi:MAG TPA: hypothetical protein VHV49_02500, partial [Pseudonocardiaceae bacterium]|nr:hypothetical protein [Pseudonocardiaceae bacterium]
MDVEAEPDRPTAEQGVTAEPVDPPAAEPVVPAQATSSPDEPPATPAPAALVPPRWQTRSTTTKVFQGV